MLVHAIKLVEDEISSATEYNKKVNIQCSNWWISFQFQCFSELKAKYGLTCGILFNSDVSNLQFQDTLNYTRVEINERGIDIGNIRSYDVGHKIIFDNLSTLLFYYKDLQAELLIYNSKYKTGYTNFKFKQVGELEQELSRLKRAYEKSLIDNIINSGQETVIDELIYEIRNTYDRVPDTNEYIYELRERKDKTILLSTGAGKWDKYSVLSIQVMKENKGGKTYEVKCKSVGQPEGFVLSRLKKDYLEYGIKTIITLNKHSKQQLSEFSVLKDSQKRISNII